MNYLGSKISLLPFLAATFTRVLDGTETTACDLFAGTGAVSRWLQAQGYSVTSNDMQYYAYVLNRAYLLSSTPTFENLRAAFPKTSGLFADPVPDVFRLLNSWPSETGFLTRNYTTQGGRLYFSISNAQRLDALRNAIEEWRKQGILTLDEYFYLLASLIEAADAVANTASVYDSFLKRLKPSARQPLKLKALGLEPGRLVANVCQRDANLLVKEITCDILYLDPPYNRRHYGACYHLLESLAAWDDPPLEGVSGMRPYPVSAFTQKKLALEALSRLIASARAKHIFLSYNDEGILTHEQIQDVLSLHGTVQVFTIPHRRFFAGRGKAGQETTEYLFHCA